MKVFLKILLIVFFIAPILLVAQNDEDSNEIDLDILRSPVSPAANLLDITNSQIQTPTDPKALMTLIKQSTNNLNDVPDELAIDLAPWILFASEKRTLEESYSDDLKDNFKNSFVFSLATQNLDSLEIDNILQVRRVATGIKFSLLRGKVNDSYTQKISDLREKRKIALGDFFDMVNNAKRNDNLYNQLDSMRIQQLDLIRSNTEISLKEFYIQSYKDILSRLSKREEELSKKQQDQANKDFKAAKEIVKDLKLKRFGWKLDFSSGLVFDFPNNNFDRGNIAKAGVWFNGGYDGDGVMSYFGIIRYLVNPDLNYSDESNVLQTNNVNNFDFGGKIQAKTSDNKFTGAIEFLYRHYTDGEVENGTRATLNMAYDIGSNRQLGIVLGRDFDGTISKDGNVIAAINLLVGLGSKTKIN